MLQIIVSVARVKLTPIRRKIVAFLPSHSHIWTEPCQRLS